MATRKEKTLGTILGSVLGAIWGFQYIENNDIPEEEHWKYLLGGGVGGAIGGYGLACIFGSPNDTINYQLFNGNKRVYHGITYENRANLRELEHVRDGKSFTKMIVDIPKSRLEAIELEKILIKKHKPIYNIQYNN